jgi:hypothetical protein
LDSKNRRFVGALTPKIGAGRVITIQPIQLSNLFSIEYYGCGVGREKINATAFVFVAELGHIAAVGR